MKLLFVCNVGENRSRTAAELFSKEHETKHAGAYEGKARLTSELLDWADVIFVMEEHQREHIASEFTKQYISKRIINLEIPDVYKYNQPELITILKKKVNKWLRIIINP
ncbi:MAG: phosphotyrosine protein phosphatase [Candidatus Nanoarchaeia archaeon]|jgi:predicted protein tyrosine phosphatase